VLVVEDHAPVAESIRKMLESRWFAADVVADGEADSIISYAAATIRQSSTSGSHVCTASR